MYRFIIVILLLGFTGYAQFNPNFEYNFPDTIPSEYLAGLDQVKATTLRKLEQSKHKNLSNKKSYFNDFANEEKQVQKNYISNTNIYFGWREMEDYVNAVMDTLLQHESETVEDFHVYIARNPENNAYSTYDSKFYLNIGALAFVNSEAELAAIIAHEYGHYKHYHAYNTYVLLRNSEKDMKASRFIPIAGGFLGYALQFETKEKLRDTELEADSEIPRLFIQSGYSLKDAIKDFNRIGMLEKTKKMKTSFNVVDFYLTGGASHPNGFERAKELGKSLSLQSKDGKSFIVSESKFYDLRSKARNEVLKLLLEYGSYYKCAKTAFEFYLLDPDNQIFTYYLLESIRRWEMMNSDFYEEDFITYQYKSWKMDKPGILNNLALNLLDLTKEEIENANGLQKIKSSKLPFLSHKDVFRYFQNEAVKANCSECFLSLGLKNYMLPDSLSYYVKKYAEFDHIRHPEFAEAILNKNISIGQNRKILLLTDLSNNEIYSSDKENFIIQFKKDMINEANAAYTSIFNVEKTSSIATFRSTNLSTYVMMRELQNVSKIFEYYQPEAPPMPSTASKKERNSIAWYILDPRYWDMCYRLGINEIYIVSLSINELSENLKKTNIENVRDKGVMMELKIKSSVYKISNMGSTDPGKIELSAHYGGNINTEKLMIFLKNHDSRMFK